MNSTRRSVTRSKRSPRRSSGSSIRRPTSCRCGANHGDGHSDHCNEHYETRKEKKASSWPGELGEPITIPFQNIRPTYAEDPEGFLRQLIKLGLQEQVKKLVLIADHYGIKDQDSAQWGFSLALRLACDLHPGFRLVYDDWYAQTFKTLWRFTPFVPMKEGENPSHRPKSTGWAPLLEPEFVALFVDTFKAATKLTNKKLVEILAVSFDPDLKKPSKKFEKKKKTATLIRRLSKGRKNMRSQKRIKA